jgi:hypothetical protein
MVYTLIATSLIILLGIGIVALFMAGPSQKSASMENPAEDDS